MAASVPLADVGRVSHVNQMDESVKLYQEEQERIAEAGGLGPWFRRHLFSTLMAYVVCCCVLTGIMAVAGLLPRNSDNSIKLTYLGPLFSALGLISLAALWRYRSAPSWIKPTLWTLMAMSVIVVFVALVDVMSRNGS